MARIINFFDGAQSETVPTIGNIVASDLINYVDDAAFEAAEVGAPKEGNIYFNTTIKLIRYYNGTIWGSLTDEVTAQVLQNKTLDGTSATGNNTITNDADKITYDNTASGRSSTDLQGLGDEYDAQLDENAGDIADIRTTTGTLDGDTDMGTGFGTIIGDNVDTKVALQQLETALELVSNPLLFQGLWNADTNTPTLASSTGTEGHFYIVSVAGTTNLDGENDWNPKDWVVFSDGIWNKIDNTDSVASVNGQIGIVVLDTDDIAEGAANKYGSGSIDTHSDVDVTTSSPVSGEFLKFDGSNFVPGDAGGSVGVVNYAEGDNSNFEASIGDWISYDDASVVPIDGIGESPVSTITRTITGSEIIRGIASGKITKDAFDRQGEGRSLPITIDPKDQGNQIIVRIDYKTTANYVTGDTIGYVYDIDNANLIGILQNDDNNGEFSAHTGNGVTFLGTFQAATNSINYRIILHLATTNSNALNMIIDRIRIGPDSLAPGAVITPMKKYLPIFTGLGTVTDLGVFFRQVGDTIEIQGKFTKGIGTAVIIEISLPNNLVTADINKVANLRMAGKLTISVSGAAEWSILIEPDSPSMFISVQGGGGAGLVKLNGNSFGITGMQCSFFATIPIQDLSASAILSTTEANRLRTKASLSLSANQTGIPNTETLVEFDQALIDSKNGFDSGANSYVIDSNGDYEIHCNAAVSNLGSNDRIILRLKRDGNLISTQSNGATTSNIGTQLTHFGTFVKGDIITMTVDTTTDNDWDLTTETQLNILKIEDDHTFSVFGNNDFLATESSEFGFGTAGYATGEWMQMTGNSIDLKSGSTYMITGSYVLRPGQTTLLDDLIIDWTSANGDNTSSNPGQINSGDGLQAGDVRYRFNLDAGAENLSNNRMNLPTIRMTVNIDFTLYAVGNIGFSAAGGSPGGLTVFIYAEKIG